MQRDSLEAQRDQQITTNERNQLPCNFAFIALCTAKIHDRQIIVSILTDRAFIFPYTHYSRYKWAALTIIAS